MQKAVHTRSCIGTNYRRQLGARGFGQLSQILEAVHQLPRARAGDAWQLTQNVCSSTQPDIRIKAKQPPTHPSTQQPANKIPPGNLIVTTFRRLCRPIGGICREVCLIGLCETCTSPPPWVILDTLFKTHASTRTPQSPKKLPKISFVMHAQSLG